MNERIRQLAEQSELWDRLDPRSLGIPGGSTESRWGEELQEFAELIVRECADACYKHKDVESFGIYPVRVAMVTKACSDNIKQHFGVEE